MNPFYWMIFFASYCNSQTTHHLNTDSENVTRYDTYLRVMYTEVSVLQYIWAIHNFSGHEKLGTGEISSHHFSVPKTDPEWFVKLTPHGTDQKNETISVDVCVCKDYSVEEPFAKYTISIINNEKQPLWSKNSTKLTQFKSGSSHGWPDFCKKNDFFRNQLLQNDTLMLLIRITVLSECFQADYRSTFETTENLLRCDTYLQKRIIEMKHFWAIHNFSIHEANGTQEIYSSMFDVPEDHRYSWRVIIYPNNIYQASATISLRVYQSCHRGPYLVDIESAEFNVSMINNEKVAMISVNTTFKEPGYYCSQTWTRFCTKNNFFRNQILQNDTLTLSASLKWTFPHTHVISYLRTPSSPRPTPKTTIIKSAISENFESMLENPTLADVIFVVNGRNYPAHSAILAARSPVFATMFQRKRTKSRKAKTIRVNVTNMNEEVLRAMLRYIYTGKCENLGKLADKLLAAAVKYGLDGLKKICEEERSR